MVRKPYAQMWVVSHANQLAVALNECSDCHAIELEKDMGQTRVMDQGMLDEPVWYWPEKQRACGESCCQSRPSPSGSSCSAWRCSRRISRMRQIQIPRMMSGGTTCTHALRPMAKKS
jgi:hypothetical protein